MSQEKYKPTPEEIEKAEAVLADDQKTSSEVRTEGFVLGEKAKSAQFKENEELKNSGGLKRQEQERLSPRAHGLIEDTRKKFSTDANKAIDNLMSVDPKELSLYDRQKIGREIMARIAMVACDMLYVGEKVLSFPDGYNEFIKKIAEDYQVRGFLDPIRPPRAPLTDTEEREQRSVYDLGKYGEYKRLNKLGDEKFEVAKQLEEQKRYYNSWLRYMWAGDAYVDAKKYDKALTCFRRALEYIENMDEYDKSEVKKPYRGILKNTLKSEFGDKSQDVITEIIEKIRKIEELKEELENRKMKFKHNL